MKDQNTALEPTQTYFIAANSAWTPAAQPATQPPPSPGWIQIFGNPKQTQTITQPNSTSLKIVGILDLSHATVVGFSGGGGGAGTVTSVALSVPNWLTVAGSPIVNAGTLAVTAASGQTPHKVLGTGTGTSFSPMSLATADLPFTYSGNSTALATFVGSFTNGHTVVADANGNLRDAGSAGLGGTVTTFSAGNLSPLFTTSVATATSTPALTFALSTTTAHTFFGNNTGITGAPGFVGIGTTDLPFVYTGTTSVLATANGTFTTNDCAKWDVNGNLVDSGASCAGSNTGTVTSVAMSVPSWLAVSGTPVTTAGTLAVTAAGAQSSHQVIGTGSGSSFVPVTLATGDLPFTYSGNTTKLGTVSGALTATHTIVSDASGNLIDSGTTGGSGTVTSVALTVPAWLTVGGSPVTGGGTLAVTAATGQTSHFVVGTFSGTSVSLAALTTADLPFTYSGNTTKVVTTTGTLTNGHCVSIDASGNFVDAGGACGLGGGGSGTVTSVALAGPTGFTISGSPVVASGTLAGYTRRPSVVNWIRLLMREATSCMNA